ncbi:hypothetical protein NPIL_564381 [Nephila pilipes]|uniref:Uncharacterized protein n=1 Tax=Nephila pilipes TaxID=299642 RepID=A0A8X6PPH2_NEPPI|nr:hypothetical protein NPIL_564381 [Nephila pilipes]
MLESVTLFITRFVSITPLGIESIVLFDFHFALIALETKWRTPFAYPPSWNPIFELNGAPNGSREHLLKETLRPGIAIVYFQEFASTADNTLPKSKCEGRTTSYRETNIGLKTFSLHHLKSLEEKNIVQFHRRNERFINLHS